MNVYLSNRMYEIENHILNVLDKTIQIMGIVLNLTQAIRMCAPQRFVEVSIKSCDFGQNGTF